MKLLLKAAFKTRKHLTLAITTLVTMLLLTMASHLEMFSLGILTNTGVDFFLLFGKEHGKRIQAVDEVSYSDITKRLKEIDKENTGSITKQDATIFIANRKEKNPLNWLFRKVSSKFHFEKNFSLLIQLLVLVALFKAIMLFLSRYSTQLFSIRVTRDLRQNYFEHIQTLSMGFYQNYNVGSLAARVVGDAGQIASSLHSCLTNYIHTPFTIITTLGMCFLLSWQLSLIIFVGLPLIILPVIYLTKKVKGVAREIQKNQESFTSVLLDFLSGIHTIKIFSAEKYSLEKYKEQNQQMAKLESKSAKYNLLTRPVLHTITTACLAFVCLFGLYTLHMSLAQLIVFCGLLHLFYEPVKKFAEENANIQRGVVAAERLFEVLHMKPIVEDLPNAVAIQQFSSSIEFDNVSFKYQNEWVLKNVSFKVKKGETVAVVGPTGAGKSTIVQLLPRLYNIQKGEIRIDGKPIHFYTQASLRSLMGFVPQKPFLFIDSVTNNLSFGKPYSYEEIVESAKRAYADEFIEMLPDKYDSILAETGKTLSGGQQQRLAIARALLKKAPILILDEATSSLDAVSESKIQSAIENLHGKVTQILIAHRLSTIKHADRIIFLERGEKIAEGTREELLASCPSFKLMWDTYHYSKSKKDPVLK